MKVLIHEWVTGGGLGGSPLPPSWAAEGRAMRRAIARDFHAVAGVEVVTTIDPRFAADNDDDDPISRVVVPSGGELAALERLTKEVDYTLVIAPETDGVLESRASLVDAAGGRSLGSSPRAIALAADKERLAGHLADRGVRTLATRRFLVADGLPPDATFPAVVKPVDGAGALHTELVGRPTDWTRSSGRPAEMVIQPYCPGVPLSASFLVGRGGQGVRLLGVGRQRVTVDNNRFSYQGGSLPAPRLYSAAEAARAVGAVPGLAGFVGVDFIGDPETGRITVLEINPRPTTSYVGLAHLLPPGALARAWLDMTENGLTEGEGSAGLSPGWLDAATCGGVDFFPDGSVRAWRGGDDDVDEAR